MCASREINGFINNRLAFVRFVSRAMLAGIKFLLCRRWKPCRKTRVEGVRNEGRGVYKVSFERGLDGRLPLVDIFFEPPSLLLSPALPRKEKSGGTMAAWPILEQLDVISTSDRTLEILPLFSNKVMEGKRNIRVIYSVLASSLRGEGIVEDSRGESILSFEEKWLGLSRESFPKLW